jgi:hypothetical protein
MENAYGTLAMDCAYGSNRSGKKPGGGYAAGLLQVGADDFDHVLGGFGGRLGFARHVIEDVVLHQFGHQAVDGPAGGGEALQQVGAMRVFLHGAKNRFELADDFFCARDEIEMFAA